MLVVTVGGLNLKFLIKFSLCVTSILKVIRMLEEFHLCDFRGDAASCESWSFSQASSLMD